jgi:glycosyltransferase involved in cell wall biosynthesis
LNILILNTYDKGGGAEQVARDLFFAYRSAGHDARMLVRYKRTTNHNISMLNPYQGTYFWPGLCAKIENIISKKTSFRGKFHWIDWLRRTAFPKRWLDYLSGVEDFNYPFSLNLLDEEWKPDIIHAHNLHGDYFDLRAFESIGKHLPIVWTLHDTWAFTGHCAYFVDCKRWLSGCGHCPDLKRPPSILLDATAKNYQTKKMIYEKSRFSVATPSRWLMSNVERSILKDKEKRVIPNGVDLSIFKQGNKQFARLALGLPEDAFICLYVTSFGAQTNPYKDYTTISRAVEILNSVSPDIFFICVGGSMQQTRQSHSLFTGYIDDRKLMALYYQASDVLLHAAHAESSGLVISEAMACGTVVVATAVGGITEQIENGQTAFLVARKDADEMARIILLLQKKPPLLAKISLNASQTAQNRFSLDSQTLQYLDWFHDLVKS